MIMKLLRGPVVGVSLLSLFACNQGPPEIRTTVSAQASLGELLSAIAAGDLARASAIVEPLHADFDGPFSLQEGVIDDELTQMPAVIRHSSVAAPIVLFAPQELALAAWLHRVDGQVVSVRISTNNAEEGGIRFTIEHSELSGAGVLTIGDASLRPGDLSAGTLAIPVIEEPWACGNIPNSCALEDYQCLVRAHATCIEQDLDLLVAREEGVEPIAQIAMYFNQHGGLGELEVERVDGRIIVTLARPLSWPALEPFVRLSLLTPEGQTVSLPILSIEERGDQVSMTTDIEPTLSDGALLILDARDQTHFIEPMAFGFFDNLQQTDWSVEGCLQFVDSFTPVGTVNRPVVNALIKLSGELLGVFSEWQTLRTDSQGCFLLSNQKNHWNRRLRLKLSFDDSLVHVRESFTLSSYFILWETAGNVGPGNHNAGTLIIGPGEPDERGEGKRQTQAASWYVAHRVNDALLGQGTWLRYNSQFSIKHPSSILDGTAWNLGTPTVYLQENSWDLGTLLHEMGHIWQYMHKSGWGWNIVYDAVHGTSTHNCQESVNVAFLEGFAEFFFRQIFTLIPEWDDFVGGARFPRTFWWLDNQPTCASESQPGLTSPGRVAQNDDGVTHALELLITDDFYRRDFFDIQSFAWSTTEPLTGGCDYYTYNWIDFVDVLLAFQANSGLGHPYEFSNDPGIGISQFYTRFRDIHGVPSLFIADRQAYWDINTSNNPNTICHNVCAPSVAWWDGSWNNAVYDAANCYVDPVPAGKTGFVSGNNYYVAHHPTCPIGGYDGASCHVLTPAPGTSPFIYAGNLYTTALSGNCPHGWFDGANCYIGTPAAGTFPFIYAGNLYTSPLPGCTVGNYNSTGCYMGAGPSGRTAFVYANNFYYSP